MVEEQSWAVQLKPNEKLVMRYGWFIPKRFAGILRTSRKWWEFWKPRYVYFKVVKV